MKRLLISVAAVFISSAASAADMLVDEPAPVGYEWSGFYAGLHAGYGWGDAGYLSDDDDGFDNGDFDGSPEFSPELDGGVAGAQAGYNWQIDNFVLGLEADVSWSGVDGDTSKTLQAGSYFLEAEANVDWLASIRGRAGVTWDRVLFYGTGGVAFAGVDTDIVTDFSGNVVSASDSSTHTGWVLGGGVEAMVTSNITVRLEYLHYEFNEDDFFYRFDPPSDAYDLFGDADLDVDAVRLGVNFLF